MTPPQLPEPLATVLVPAAFHPSSFTQLERCPTSVLGLLTVGHDGLLVSHPSAYLGVALHHVRHEILKGRWGDATEPREAALLLLDMAVREAEAALRRDSATAGLVPLRQSVGRRAWTTRTRDLKQWAAKLTTTGMGEPPRALTLSRSSAPPAPRDAAHAATGCEQVLANPALRLQGRPDWSAHVGEGRIDVVDFKSGRHTDADGRPLEDHVVQVQLYAMLLESAFPGAHVRPFVEQVDRVQVPWGDRERSQLVERLRKVAEKLPAGAPLRARECAKPGAYCGRCRLRPVCTAYIDAAPTWWPDGVGHPRPLPLDVWGTVVNVQAVDDSDTVRLIDASGRRVRVDGLERSWGTTTQREGDAVWFFDLESSEDLEQHGAMIQPRNFHQSPPGPRWKRANRLRTYLGR